VSCVIIAGIAIGGALLLIQVRADVRGIRAIRDDSAAVFAFHKSAPVLRSQAIRLGLFLLL
jgi:hypothetical protein